MYLKYGFKFLKHGSLWIYRLATWAVLVLGLGFAVTVVALRYLLLPAIDSYREPIVQAVSAAIGQKLSVGRIEGSWRGYRPELRLFDVEVDEPGGQVALKLERVDTVLSWVSLLAGQLNFHSLEILRPALEVRRDSLGMLWIAGDPIDTGGDDTGGHGLRDWLFRQGQIIVRDAQITWIDEMRGARPLVIAHANLRIDNASDRHRFGLTGKPPVDLASAISLRGDFVGDDARDPFAWRGRLYGDFEYANLATAATWIALPISVDSGLGALRLWIDVADRQVVSASADFDMVNVRAQLSPDLEWLDVASVSGDLGWRHDAAGARVSGHALAFQIRDGQSLPPFDFELRRGNGEPARYTLSLTSLELGPFGRLAKNLPIGPVLQARIAAFQPGGRLTQARIAWRGEDGEASLESAQLAFNALALRPVGHLPGVRGFSGSVSAGAAGGTVSLKGQKGFIELPEVFDSPVPLDFLAAEADWTVEGEQVALVVRSASFTNAHAAGSVYGTYQSASDGPGSVDLRATLVRGDARDVWRYVPKQVEKTRAWLQRALLAGRTTGANIALSGPLQLFPFRDGKSGRFEILAQVEGVRLDYAQGWPVLEDVAGVLSFRGDEMQMSARAGRILDIDLAGTHAGIAGLGGHAEHLRIAGEASGPVPGFLRFVGDSPVNGYIGRVTEKMRGEGNGHLSLSLDLPLHQIADTAVSGRFRGSGERFSVDPRVPELTNYSAKLEFSRRELSISDGRATFLGGPLRFGGGKRKNGSIELNMDGALSAAELARRFEHPAWRGVRGEADWRGRLSFLNKQARLSVQSSLTGIESSLPSPLDKPAAATLPLNLELQERAGAERDLNLSLGERMNLRLLLDGERIRRGVVAFGGAAAPPAREGIQVLGKLASLDVDAWRSALRDAPARAQSREDGGAVDGIDLAIESLEVGGRRYGDVRIAGQRISSGWRASLESRQGKGELTWAAAQGGRMTARFSRLAIPAQVSSVAAASPAAATQAWRETLPGLDLIAEDFSFEGKALGRLDLLADPDAQRWHLERLALTNPDGRLDVSGDWIMSDRPRTNLQVRVQAANVGKLLARLGYSEDIKGGTGSLSGPVSWVGTPYRPDLPTLNGRLKLEAKSGRFAQAEPGAAKLLGLLSLQALPRRLSLDFRDLFSSGFSFESIEANVALSNGIAQTDDFRMLGSAARVQIKGSVDLAAETQALEVRVIPQLSTAAAVAGAVLNPVVGVATLVLQKALGDPVEEMAARDYKVTGSWTDPNVQRVGHGSDPETANQRK